MNSVKHSVVKRSVVKQYTLLELADFLQAELKGEPEYIVSGLSTLQDARPESLAFLANPAYAKYLPETQAGAVILSPDMAAGFAGNAIVMDNPYLGFARVSCLFDAGNGEQVGIHPSAVVAESATVDPQAWIGPNSVVEAGAEIAAGARILGSCYIGQHSCVGADTVLKANVTLYHGVTVGARCIIHAGAVLGSDGFGFAHANGEWIKIAQLGGVVIGNDVEIGANTAIDRGALGNTVIHDGVKLDNLIQIAHNVEIGRNTAIAGNVGISGSTKVGSGCTIAGGSSLAGHLTIADNVHIAGVAMITKSINGPGEWSSGGIGMMPVKEWRKNTVRFRQLDDMARRLKVLEKAFAKSE